MNQTEETKLLEMCIRDSAKGSDMMGQFEQLDQMLTEQEEIGRASCRERV